MQSLGKFAAIVAIAALAVSSAGARGGGVGTNHCGDGDGTGHELTWTPTTVWPPNHKPVDITITYTDESEDHQLTLAATSATHDEIDPETGEELNGAGNTDSDWTLPADAATGTGEVSITLQVLGERSGRGDGRRYTVDYTAMSMNGDGEDNDCSGQITVDVPHDCRKGACDITKPSKSQEASARKQR